MKTNENLRQLVKEKYSSIAMQSKEQNSSSCCGSGSCSTEVYNIMSDDYAGIEGYNPEADMGLGCGLPTEYAILKSGDTVVDLGSGAGNDCFVARAIVGEHGKVIGIDFTEAMIDKARENAEKLRYNNVEFRWGEIEKMPLTADVADVIVSNCVLNLVPDKAKAFSEIFRVLKPGGHFSISDVVLQGELPSNLKEASEMYAGCVAGAMQKSEYLALIEAAGFKNIRVQKEKVIRLPDDILSAYLSETELNNYKNKAAGIFSITTYAEKSSEASCCAPGCCETKIEK
jgi:arsenite methyltransferase